MTNKSFDALDAQSASISEINADLQLDPTVSDWGQAINDALTTIVEGESIYVPHAQYDLSTTAQLDKDCKIYSESWSKGNEEGYSPQITQQSDVPAIETGNGIEVELSGLNFTSGISGTTSGIILHGSGTVENVLVRQFGSHGLVLDQASTGDNLNKTRVIGFGGRYLGGEGVLVQNVSTDSRNVNAVEIDVRNAVNLDGWAINADEGMGNKYHVQHMADFQGNMLGGIRLNTDRSTASVTYAEGNVEPVIQFDSGSNTGIVGHTGAAEVDVFQDNAGGNRKLNRNYNTYVDYEKSGSEPWRFRGGFEADTLATEAGGRRVALQHVDSISQTTGTTTQSLSLSGSYASYLVDYFLFTDSATGDVQLAFNGDGSGNGNYTYWDETGTKSTGDYIPLTTTTGGFTRITGELTITDAERGGGSEIETGVSHDFGGGRTGRLDGFAQSGSRTVQEQVTSMELTLPSASEFIVDVYGVVER